MLWFSFFLKKEIWLASTWFELMDCELQFMIHFDYFMKHFFLLFMKFTNQFFKAQQSFDFVIKYYFTK